jgi:hypothetical protein
LGGRPTTCRRNKLTVRKLNCGLGTVSLARIDPGSGKGFMSCGTVYKQILINAKLNTGKRGQNTELTGRRTLRR